MLLKEEKELRKVRGTKLFFTNRYVIPVFVWIMESTIMIGTKLARNVRKSHIIENIGFSILSID